MKEMLGGCCVCADENGWEANPLVYCDGPNCEVAVHQGCYGIIKVPEGEWYCAKCTDMLARFRQNVNGGSVELPEPPRCMLCHFRYGALKKTDTDGWAHVICALYIPEVRFGDVHSMDPVILSDVPLERFQHPCYICEERGDDKQAMQGACMSCNKLGCKKGFHVTCAQAEGLLCEEGSGSKNVKYCGYCSAHAKKAIGDPLIKVIPAYRHRTESSSCSSTTSGGGQQISPSHNSGNNISSTDHYINRAALFSSSPLSSGVYSHSASVTPSSATSAHLTPPANIPGLDSGRQRETDGMLVDPIHRTPLQPTSVDRAMMNAVFNQPANNHTLLDASCSPPISSGRSSIVQKTPPPVIASLSYTKSEHHSNLDMLATSVSVVQLPSNLSSLICGNSAKVEVSPPLGEKPIKNGNMLAPLAGSVSPEILCASVKMKCSTPVSSVPKAIKRPRISESGERPKRQRNNNKSGKSVKALLESVGPLVSETVSDFQRERVNERDAAAAAAAAAAVMSPSTSHAVVNCLSSDQTVSYEILSNNVQMGTANTAVGGVSSAAETRSSSFCSSYQPSMSVASTSNSSSALVGVPLLRYLPKGLSSPESNISSLSIDRQHVSNNLPSTSVGSGVAIGNAPQQSPFPQSMEELLERQWEQGSHFLMGHAPFDIAQLLSCLHELKMENVRLENSMSQLVRRRDHLLALNARLSLSLTSGTPSAMNGSPHHSPRIGVTSSHQLTMSVPPLSSSILSLCPASTSSSSVACSVSSINVMPSSTVPQSQHISAPASLLSTSSVMFNSPSYTNGLSPIIDDSLSQLRSLASASGFAGSCRNLTIPSSSVQIATSMGSLTGRPASRQAASISTSSSAMSQASQHSFTQARCPSVAGSVSATHVITPSSTPTSTLSTTPKSSLVGGLEIVSHPGSTASNISPERQLAVAAVAAAANALGSGFLAPRTPTQLGSASTTGGFGSQDILTQYAILAQQQILQHQAAAVAAAAARYGGLVMQGSTTPPNIGSTSQASNPSHSGK